MNPFAYVARDGDSESEQAHKNKIVKNLKNFIKRTHEDPAQLDNLVGIKYFRTPCYSGGYDPCSYSYAVGAKDYSSFKLSMPKAYLVRQIIRKNGTEPDKVFIEKLLNLMQVGFVKYNENTVLPFPNKYLNEITRLLKGRDPITFGVNQ